MRKKKNIMKIGTDPEMALINNNNGEVTRANAYSFFGSCGPNDKIGCDGAGTPVELRPSAVPLTRIRDMDNEIAHLYQKIDGWCRKKNLFIEGGAIGGKLRNGISIGAHIHFGSEELKTNYRDLDYGRNLPIPEVVAKDNINRLTRSMDTYFTPIANFFIKKEEIIQRRKIGYGKLGEYRNQPWGIEYRTPYCFLMSPLLTGGLYALASLIGYNYKKLNPNINLYRRIADYYYSLTNGGECDSLHKKIYKTIKPRLLRLMGYNSPNPDYNSKIVSLFNIIERGKKIVNKNILNNYKFVGNIPFTVYYGSNDHLRYVRRSIDSKLSNNTKGEIYIYQISGSSNRRHEVVLSRGLPKMECSAGIKVYKEDIDIDSYKYSIGLSPRLVDDLANGYTPIIFLVKYLNKLKLREFNTLKKGK